MLNHNERSVIRHVYSQARAKRIRSLLRLIFVISLTVISTVALVEVAHSHFKWRACAGVSLLAILI